MTKLIMCKGLPGSGKTTWAKTQNAYRINKDDLRLMFNNGVWSKHNEKHVLEVRDILVTYFIKEHDVIVDDTNLAPKHELSLREIAKQVGCDFEVKDFTDVPLEICLERDRKRPNWVGEKVIRKMYNQFLKPEPETVEVVMRGQIAIICDLDGTLCEFGNKNPYDRDFENDEINPAVRYVLEGNDQYNEIIFTSGRSEKYRKVTQEWLDRYGFGGHPLFMRKEGDNRKDCIIKQEIYEQKIKGKYNILFVLDDRDQVVSFWRSKGLTCFQVAEGDF